MTVTFGFFNSVNGDRKYDAEDFSEIFDGIIEDGVHRGIGDDFFVTATGGNTVAVGTGRAWFDHTWTKSDTAIPFVIDAAHASLNRIDAIILEVDHSSAVRANQIRYLRGTPNATPQRPTLTKTATLTQYALSYIYRPLNSGSITQAQITNVVGSSETPYAVSRLLDRAIEPASMRRNVVRGKNLGSSYTAAQQAAVSSGSFEDLYLGDYWVINGINWRIVDFDYYYNTGQTERLFIHHLVVMPDDQIRTGPMNVDFFKANGGAYVGCDMRTLHIPPMLTMVFAAFPEARILTYQTLLTNTMGQAPYGSVPMDATWVNTRLELPSQAMFYGSSNMLPASYGGNIPPYMTADPGGQFALFRLAPWFVPSGLTLGGAEHVSWTRDVLSPAVWSCVSNTGVLTRATSSQVYGFRPYFCLK